MGNRSESSRIMWASDSVSLRPGKSYADTHAARILCDSALCSEIAHLFEQNIPCPQIAERLNGRMGLHPDTKERTAGGIVYRVVCEVVPEEKRRKIVSQIRSDVYEASCRDSIEDGRNKWIDENGLVRFLPEETKRLFELRSTYEGRCNNQEIANQMNIEFQTGKFTKENCRQHAANIQFKNRDPNKRKKRLIFGPKKVRRLEELAAEHREGKITPQEIIETMVAEFRLKTRKKLIRERLRAMGIYMRNGNGVSKERSQDVPSPDLVPSTENEMSL